jgi:Uma2 family endonuclease
MVITTSPLVKMYTLREFWEIPEPSDHSKLELIKGVLYMTPPPDYSHNWVSANLIEMLVAQIKMHGYRGKVYVPRAAVWIDDDTYLEPDLMYISAELKTQMSRDHWTRADIVVEVISPSNKNYDRRTKSDTYQAMGVRELWLVDPEKEQVEVRSFEAERTAIFNVADILKSAVLTRIEILLSELCQRE